MKKLFLPLVLLISASALPQQAPLNSPLLDHLAGQWILQGIIAGQQTTHDVDVSWEIQHHYLQIREVSREKNAAGQPQYEAIIYVAWNEDTRQYACVWLDVYGSLNTSSLGFATPKESEIPFTFRNTKGEISFSNVFAYDPKTDTWEWRMDNIEKGVAKPFGRVKLQRKSQN